MYRDIYRYRLMYIRNYVYMYVHVYICMHTYRSFRDAPSSSEGSLLYNMFVVGFIILAKMPVAQRASGLFVIAHPASPSGGIILYNMCLFVGLFGISLHCKNYLSPIGLVAIS